MKTFKTPEGERTPLPETPFYSFVSTPSGDFIVPCFSEAETALIEWYALRTGLAVSSYRKETIHKLSSRRFFSLGGSILVAAASMARDEKLNRYFRSQLPRKCFELKSTANKILKPAREKNSRELRNEIIRRGV